MATTLHRLVKFIGVAAAAVTLGLAPGAMASAAPPPEPTMDPLIVGGTAATTQQYPWTVALLLDGTQWCGGTLAAPNKVVTAAHCTSGKAVSRWQIVAGRTDLRTSEGHTAKVTKVWQHPNYRSVTQGDDVAVMTLDRNLNYTTLPLAKSTDSALYQAGTQARALGWGDTTGNGDYSDTLRQVVVPLTSDQTCSTAYSEYKNASMVCAGFPQGGKDTCQADSGGPLVVSGKLVGITSWGEGCAQAGKPGVYARVSSYYTQLTTQISS
ncbi:MULTISPECIES: trypsin-like serine protease [unclassified Crossiella]|uniref:S1 family peptidase n=1 Tax=unclassified Crossiella TaxID=2620835 RepID=UPI001FFE539A|nr:MULTISPECIES: serine protease [unclassified Crossiella]MCK2242543.1 serine protease [Crossiella sp. S99.2]MCK2254427.1 serine protease [Crossiella sp. S99.1]